MKYACILSVNTGMRICPYQPYVVMVDTPKQVSQMSRAFKDMKMNTETAKKQINQVIEQLGFGVFAEGVLVEGIVDEPVMIIASA